MAKNLYLINPRADFPTYFSAEVYAAQGLTPVASSADLALPTVAAMAARDFSVRLCDENVSLIDFDAEADFVGITGKVSQQTRMIEIAREFRRRGKVVVFGGPNATLSPERLRSECDILVRGEIEPFCKELFAELGGSAWRRDYSGGKPDLSQTPIPDWTIYPNDRALMGTAQTSRGCPFECEFCDVIQYLGRSQRHKPIPQVLAELDALYALGYRTVFLADDNFTVYRSRTKELLVALEHWNESQLHGKVAFSTQVSIDCARDDEMLAMCAEAGLNHVFIGIETPNEASLKASLKRQNVGVDLASRICKFLDHGISVTAGMIVGFDADTKDIFERQYEFAMSVPVPIFSIGALVAPMATPLYSRMLSQHRLIDDGCEVIATPWNTNIIPQQMSRYELMFGIRWLCNRLYRPEAFTERMLSFLHRFRKNDIQPASRNPLALQPDVRPIEMDRLTLVQQLIQSGPAEKAMVDRIAREVLAYPAGGQLLIGMLGQYSQIRHMYDKGEIWDPPLGSLTSPPWNDMDDSHFVREPFARPATQGVAAS